MIESAVSARGSAASRIARLFPPGAVSMKIVPACVDFYIMFGMYLFVLALWFPYIMNVFMSPKTKMQGRS